MTYLYFSEKNIKRRGVRPSANIMFEKKRLGLTNIGLLDEVNIVLKDLNKDYGYPNTNKAQLKYYGRIKTKLEESVTLLDYYRIITYN